MTIFLSQNLPQQPAFLYATYRSWATASASTSASGFLAADMLQADENNGWKPANTSPVTLTIDLGAAEQTDYLALAGNNLAGASVAVSGSSDNSSFVSLLAATTITASGEFWTRYTRSGYRYLRISISGHSSAFTIKHLVVNLLTLLPFMEDGYCSAPMQAEGQHLISEAGLFLGSITHRVLAPFELSFGQVTPVEEAAFDRWAQACIRTAQAFFFVPDTGLSACHFGYVEKKIKWNPTMKAGLVTIPRITFTARAV